MEKNALFKLSYGLYVLGVNDGNKPNGCIINIAVQLTSNPYRIAVTVNKANYTHDVLMKSKNMTLSVLDITCPFDIFKRFGFQSGKEVNKFDGFDMYDLKDSLPYLTQYANAYMKGHVIETLDELTHTMFIVELDDAVILNDHDSMTYDYYFKNVKPKPEKKKKGWVCKICGWVYEGDELPEDLICPICKHPASDFEPL